METIAETALTRQAPLPNQRVAAHEPFTPSRDDCRRDTFDWGRKKRQLAEKSKSIEQAENTLKETEDQILIEVGDKLRRLQQTQQALRVARLSQGAEREALRITQARYRVEAARLTEVLQSQAMLADANNQYQQALLSFWTAKAELEKAIGEDI